MTGRLRLRALDEEDLAVIASVLADARIPLAEMAFDPETQRFMAAFARYCREQPAAGGLTECTSILVFEHVRAAFWRGLEPASLDAEHRLLTIVDAASDAAEGPDPDECETPLPEPECAEGCTAVTLYFQGGEAIRLTVQRLECHLEDFGEPRAAVEPPRIVPVETGG
ncbi:MAG: DUF2948 family protein [Geminicoccaceae bacterium]|nr:MAG: DUF2948 family protein [Geminicoccaceae bacterium]